jgi:branched-chain amino acid transport system permease protein
VVVTGLVGQANLAPLAFAAVGAFGVSLLGSGLGIPFPLPILLAALVAVPVGLLIGLPALRIRGTNLAIVTLGVGVVMDVAVFQNYTVSGGQAGRVVPSPALFGLSLDAGPYPVRYGVVVLAVLGVLAVAVGNMRRGSLGRRMLAVRSNERAAAAAGINVAGVKLAGFGISAFIAAVGGGLLAYQFGTTSSTSFVSTLSLSAVALAFIGGIASVSGAFTAGLMTSGGVVYVLLNTIGGISPYWVTLTGLLLVLTVISQPDGVAVKNIQVKAALRARFRHRRTAGTSRPTAPLAEASAPR